MQVHVHNTHTHSTCDYQKMTLKSWFFHFLWLPEMKLGCQVCAVRALPSVAS